MLGWISVPRSFSIRSSIPALVVLAITLSGVACNGLLGNEDIVFDVPLLDAAPDADLDAGPAPVDSSSPLPDAGCTGETCERVVFVTSQSFQGNLGGLTGADALCKLAAEAPGSIVRGRTFVAWVSDSTTFASTRHVHGTQSYKGTDGRVVAASWDQLTSGNLQAPIDHDETGTLHTPAPPEVWTGTEPNGDRRLPDCNDWTTSSPEILGAAGTWSAADAAWTANRLAHLCSTPAALYCFER